MRTPRVKSLSDFCATAYKGIEALDLTALTRKIGTVDWSNPQSIYRLGLPSFCLEQVEDIERRINFEILAEGRPTSAQW